MTDRHLHWDGCYNVRDLGGLRARDRQVTRWGAVVRADTPDRLTASGWDALRKYGIRTIIDLRNDGERRQEPAARLHGVMSLHLPLDGIEVRDFWDAWVESPDFGTPRYFLPHLKRFPARNARVIAAVAKAPPGGILIHCENGRDRTGQISVLLLALAGVAADDIAADYSLSTDCLRRRSLELGEEDEGATIGDHLARQGTSAQQLITSTLASLDVEGHLRRGGLRARDVAGLRARLLGTCQNSTR